MDGLMTKEAEVDTTNCVCTGLGPPLKRGR